MAVTIGSNLAAQRVIRNLAASEDSVVRASERLSSGQRINRASDDAAGLAIASTLNSLGRIHSQAIRNINDGVSLLSIAEGAAQELKGILTRVTELAEQSANGTYGNTQRQGLDNEVNALQNEYNRIVTSTQFNGINIFDSNTNPLVLQVGTNSSGTLTLSLAAESASQRGDGTFSLAGTPAAGYDYQGPDNILAGDFNNDGKTDLLVTDSAYVTDLLLGNGNGTFGARTNVGSVSSSPYGTTVADFNGDGNLDFAVADSVANRIKVYRGNGNGTFQVPLSYDGGTEGALYGQGSYDFNGDGRLDLLTTSFADNNFGVLLGNGDGTFGTRISTTGGNSAGPVVADFNGDHVMDVLRVFADAVYMHSGNGNGTFGAGISTFFGGNLAGLTSADINSDGKADLIGLNTFSTTLFYSLGNGNGTFGAAINRSYTSASAPYILDLNGDQRLDILYQAVGSGQIQTILGNGNGTFLSTVSSVSGVAMTRNTIGDFNGDGLYDVVSLSGANDTFNVFTANSSGTQPIGITTISGLSVSSRTNALSTLMAAKSYLDDVNTVVGVYGANLSRLRAASAVVSTLGLNSKAAESRIRDADIAIESSNLIRSQIVQQTAAAVLAHANLEPQLVVTLLS